MRDDEEDDQRGRFLVLLRHGIAEDAIGDMTDAQRSLTAEGHARMKQIARGLEKAFPKAQAIYSSPLLRASQTALWVAKAYRSRIRVETTDVLVPGGTAKEFAAFIDGLEDRRIILVGHEPTLTDNVMSLVGLSTAQGLELKKGGCYGVRLHGDHSGVLEWLLSPRILRKLSEEE